MRYHDFHLRGYRVEAHGARIVLDLLSDYPGQEKRKPGSEYNFPQRPDHNGPCVLATAEALGDLRNKYVFVGVRLPACC